MTRARTAGLLTTVLWLQLVSGTSVAQELPELSDSAFTIRYDESGIRSLRRTNDVHDTDYISANGTLGRLLVRFRTTPNGHWRELRDALLLPRAGQNTTIEYALGTLLPTLASRASPSSERGVGGLRALSDGLVPAATTPAGGRGRGGPPAGQSGVADTPLFSWTVGPNEPGGGGPGAAGIRRWVQYTFPIEEEVSASKCSGSRRRSRGVAGLPGGQYTVTIDGKPAGTIEGSREARTLRIGSSPTAAIAIVRKGS